MNENSCRRLSGVIGALILAWSQLAAQAQVIIGEMLPSHGIPGDKITLSGTGFSATTPPVIQMGNRTLPVASFTSTNVVFQIPPGAVTDQILVTVGGATVTNFVPLQVDRRIAGTLQLPPNVTLQGYQVASSREISAPVSADRAFTVAVPQEAVSFLWAFRTENDPAFMAVVLPATRSVNIGSASTASAMLFLTPQLSTRDTNRAAAILSALISLSEVGQLAAGIESLARDGTLFTQDARFLAAAERALEAFQALPSGASALRLLSLKPSPSGGAWVKDLGVNLTGARQHLQSTLFDPDATTPEDYRLHLDTFDGMTNPLDWVVEVYRLAPNQFPQGRVSVDSLDSFSAPRKVDGQPVATGFIHATLGAAKLDILDRLTTWALEKTLFPPDDTRFSPNDFVFDREIPGVYVTQATSGNIFHGTDFFEPGRNQSFLLSQIDADSDWSLALAANVVISAIDLASVIVDVSELLEHTPVNSKIFVAIETDVIKAIQIQKHNGTIDKAVLGDILKVAANAFMKESIKQFFKLGENRVGTLIKVVSTTVGAALDIPGKVSSVGQSIERFGSLFRLETPALERSVVIVGEPWYPVITDFSPQSGRSGDIVRIDGYNFPNGAAGLKVSFGIVAGTTTDTNAPPTQLIAAQIVSVTNNTIVVVVPDNWQGLFPDLKAFIYVQATNGPAISTANLSEPFRQFTFFPKVKIFSVSPNPVRSQGLVVITGTNFLAGAIQNNQILLDGRLQQGLVLNGDGQTIVAVLPFLSDGPHTIQVQVAKDTSDPFTFTVQKPAPDVAGYKTGLTITVTKLDFSNAPDGEISLLEAALIANGTLGRPIEPHLDCEKLASDNPDHCPQQRREIDFVSGLDKNGAGGGPNSRDAINLDFTLTRTNHTVSGVLPAPTNGDAYNLTRLTIDGGGAAQDGWLLDGVQGVTLSGATLRNFGGNGIHFRNGATGNQISGVTIQNCGGEGVFFDQSAKNNYMVSVQVTGAGRNGLRLSGDQVQLNFVDLPGVGTFDILGLYERSAAYGILIENGAHWNTVYPGTVRSNALDGIRITGATTGWNTVGRNADVIPRLYDIYSNGGPGVHLMAGVQHTIIHYVNPAGNKGDGILLEGPDCATNQVESVYTGVSYYNGSTTFKPQALPNQGSGIHLRNGAHHNLIGGRIPGSFNGRGAIAGDRDDGILLEGADTAFNTLNRMHIGTIEPTTFAMPFYFPNGANGIHIRNGSHDNMLGDVESFLDLHIMASRNAAIFIEGFGSDNNVIVGNQIGGNHQEGPIPDEGKNRYGIYLKDHARGNVIGQPGTFLDFLSGFNEIVFRFANVIANSTGAGVVLDNCGGSVDAQNRLVLPNRIENNKIGEQDFGLAGPNRVGIWLINGAEANIIGGPRPAQGNRIVNNATAGINLDGNLSDSFVLRNRFLNNLIDQPAGPPSVTISDPLQLPPPAVGVLFSGGAAGNVFGESLDAPNTVQNHFVGVYMDGGTQNHVRGNLLTSNLIAGVIVRGGTGNAIGDAPRNTGNRIVVNGQGKLQQGGILISGGSGNSVQANLIGDQGAGNRGVGILILGSPDNTVGGRPGAGNLVLANSSHGIQISGAASERNKVQENLIGTDDANFLLLRKRPNLGDGVHLDTGASGNLIGGIFTGALAGNLVQGPAPNTIAFNTGSGVVNDGAATLGNSILDNAITANGVLGIQNIAGGNHQIPPPALVSFDGSTITGRVLDLTKVPAGSTVQVFSDPDPLVPEGAQWMGEGTVAADGSWTVDVIGPQLFASLTMTSTHAVDGSTSEFGTAVLRDIGFSVQGVGNGLAKDVAPGQGPVVVLPFRLAASNATVRVQSITFSGSGTLPGAGAFTSAQIYRDVNHDQTIDAGDVLLSGGPGTGFSGTQFTIQPTNAVVEANTSQQWLLALSVSSSAPSGAKFQMAITNALAVAAEFAYPAGATIVPGGFFPVSSPIFTVSGAASAPLRLAFGQILPGGAFQMVVTGPAGQTVRVQISTDLVHWSDLKTIVLQGQPITIRDDLAPQHPILFYQALSP